MRSACRFATPRAAVLLSATAVLAGWGSASAQDSGNGAPAAPATVADLQSDSRFGYPAIALTDLERLGFTEVMASGGVVSASVGEGLLELYVGSPFFRFRRKTQQLPNPPYQADGTYWIPASLIAERSGWSGRPVSGEASPAETSSASGGFPQTSEEAGSSSVASLPPKTLRVVIDPGHGGRDPGTIGRRGTREKDVVLAIGKLVHQKLKAIEGIEPILTRDRDVLIPLRKRSQMAVSEQADLFLSIHANASRNRKAQGFETYFLGEARTELSREVAMRENSVVQYEDEGEPPREEDIQFILARLNLTSFQRESSRFGGYVQNSMRGVLRTPDRGVKQNVFWVLVGSTGSMPSILVEIGFLSNPEEEKLLRSKKGQEKVADAIVNAVAAYHRDYAPRLQAAGAR